MAEKLDIINRLKKVNKLLTYGTVLDWLIVAYIQYVIMLVDL